MSLLPLTFQLSSGTNQEFEDDNSSSRLGGGTAEGGAPRAAPGAPPAPGASHRRCGPHASRRPALGARALPAETPRRTPVSLSALSEC